MGPDKNTVAKFSGKVKLLLITKSINQVRSRNFIKLIRCDYNV